MSPLPSPNPGFSSCPLHVWYCDTLRFRAEAHFDCIFYHRETTRHRFLSASSVNLKSPGVLSGRLPLADEQLRGIAAAINCGIMQAGHQGAIKKFGCHGDACSDPCELPRFPRRRDGSQTSPKSAGQGDFVYVWSRQRPTVHC